MMMQDKMKADTRKTGTRKVDWSDAAMLPPPIRIIGRGLLRAVVAAAAAMGAGEAMGQLGYEYDWAQRYGSNLNNKNDYGKGVAVLTDGVGSDGVGTVVSVGEFTGNYSAGSGTTRRKAYVTFVTPGSPLAVWSRQFVEVDNAEAIANAVAVNSPYIEGTLRHAFVVGWYDGEVNFGEPFTSLESADQKDGYVARIDRDAQAPYNTDWVTSFSGDGDEVCLAVAAGPPCGVGAEPEGEDTETVRQFSCALGGTAPTVLAVGGYFTDEIIFPYYNPQNDLTVSATGNEDAFLALVYSNPSVSEAGAVYHAIGFGSSGNDGVTGVAFDPVDQSVYVTGYFSGTDINFDPDYHPDSPYNEEVIGPNAYSGGTDIFVAKYVLMSDPSNQNDPVDLRLVWVCCSGTSGDDSGTGIAVDAGGNGYAVGWKGNVAGSNRDIWVGRYPRESGCVTMMGFGPGTEPIDNWSLLYSASGNQQANGIALDGIGRLVIVGQFAGTVDFDRGAGTDNRTSAGGDDIFLTRLRPDGGGYLGTETFGSAKGEVGAAVAIDPVQSMRVAHAGWFGAPDAGNTYTVDFDPGGTTNLTCKGKADGYAAALVPDFPSGVQTQVTLVLDKSSSVTDDPYQAMVNAYYEAITDPDVIPRDGTSALNVVFYGELSPYEYSVVEELPWTVIDSEAAATLFANQLRYMARRSALDNHIDEALTLAEASHERAAGMGLDGCYHILSLSSDGRNHVEGTDPGPGPGAADLEAIVFDAGGLLDSAYIDQIDGYAAKPFSSQAYYLTYMAGANVPGAAFALETKTNAGFEGSDPDTGFLAYLRIMLSREAHCPGDYNGDGVVDGDDATDFDDDFDNEIKKADLNWDGVFDTTDQAIFVTLTGIGCCE